jgi:hypothetical protein
MHFLLLLLFATSALRDATFAFETTRHDKRSLIERDGEVYNVFEHAATESRIEFVADSGICETTPGVKQYSGYLSVGDKLDMWFWWICLPFPQTALLTM